MMIHRTRLKLAYIVIVLAFIEGVLLATILPRFPITEVFAIQTAVALGYIGFKTGNNISWERNNPGEKNHE